VCEAKAKAQNNVWFVQLPGGPNVGEWHRLRIDVVGNKISYYIDDKLRHQVKDNLHTSGGVNLYAYNAIVEFDNVVIKGDDIPNAGPSGGYAVQPKSKLPTMWGQLKSVP